MRLRNAALAALFASLACGGGPESYVCPESGGGIHERVARLGLPIFGGQVCRSTPQLLELWFTDQEPDALRARAERYATDHGWTATQAWSGDAARQEAVYTKGTAGMNVLVVDGRGRFIGDPVLLRFQFSGDPTP